MKLLCLAAVVLTMASCQTVLWSVVEVDAGRDREDPNEIAGVSVGVPVVPFEARLSVESKD